MASVLKRPILLHTHTKKTEIEKTLTSQCVAMEQPWIDALVHPPCCRINEMQNPDTRVGVDKGCTDVDVA